MSRFTLDETTHGIMKSLIDSMSQNVPTEDRSIVPVMSNNPVLYPELNLDIIINKDRHTDDELVLALMRSYDIIITLENMKLICDKRMLGILSKSITSYAYTNRINTSDVIPVKNKILWCRIVYETFIKTHYDEFEYEIQDITTKMFTNEVNRITGFGISRALAVRCVLARYSGGDTESLNIKNLNYEIAISTDNAINEQNIINIYETLFSSISSLFAYTLYDFDNTKNYPDRMYDIMTLESMAVLEMLNSQTSQVIEIALRTVSSIYSYNYTGGIRFSPLSISGDYERVRYIAEMLNSQGIIMPR